MKKVRFIRFVRYRIKMKPKAHRGGGFDGSP